MCKFIWEEGGKRINFCYSLIFQRFASNVLIELSIQFNDILLDSVLCTYVCVTILSTTRVFTKNNLIWIVNHLGKLFASCTNICIHDMHMTVE